MKVYVVYMSHYDEWENLAVFKSKEAAQKYRDSSDRGGSVFFGIDELELEE